MKDMSKALSVSYRRTSERIGRSLHEPRHVEVTASLEDLAKIRHPMAKDKGSKSSQVRTP